MNKTEVQNIEEMSNKIIEYIHAVADDYELQCMGVAAKMVLASFSFDKRIRLSGEQIITRCNDLCNMIFALAIH